jgi:hypothetical protein
VGAPGDLMLLAEPLERVLAAPSASAVVATVIEGAVVARN